MTTILFADDHPGICEYCRQALEDEGYEVRVAHDGGEAVRMVPVVRPDVVVLDVCMPGISGLEAAPMIRQCAPHVPIVFFTAWDDACQQGEGSFCANACVEKSEDLSELKRVIAASIMARRDGRPYRLGLPPRESSRLRRGAVSQRPSAVRRPADSPA